MLLMILNFKSFSQTDTNKICFDKNVAKQIAKDLIKGDACQLENQQLYLKIGKLEEREAQKDSSIVILKQKDFNNELIIGNQQKQISEYKEVSSKLEEKVKKTESQNKLYKTVTIITTTTTVILGTILIIIL